MRLSRVSLAALVVCLFAIVASSWAASENPTSSPLVSVIIPTYQRQPFLTRALNLIRAQDYPNIEIVVVDDSPEPSLSAEQVGEFKVTYIHLTERKSIGEKRNIAVTNAKGELIVHWDDDDYFRTHRISAQVQPILDGETDMTVLEHHFYLIASSKEFYTVKRASSWGPHFATFTYKRAIFESGIRYPDNSLAEDYAFAEQALEQGYQIKVMANFDGKHIYVRHTNTWKIDFALYDAQVAKVEKPDFISEEEVNFYAQASKTTRSEASPVNAFPSENIKWNRAELMPAERSSTPAYPHYDTFTYNTGGMIISIPVAVVIVSLTLAGIIAAFYYQRRQSVETVGGYQPLGLVTGERATIGVSSSRGYGSV